MVYGLRLRVLSSLTLFRYLEDLDGGMQVLSSLDHVLLPHLRDLFSDVRIVELKRQENHGEIQ